MTLSPAYPKMLKNGAFSSFLSIYLKMGAGGNFHSPAHKMTGYRSGALFMCWLDSLRLVPTI